MRVGRRFKDLLCRFRRLIVIGPTLLGYAFLTFGLPLPAHAANKPVRPASCPHQSCGCCGSASCHCCCSSDQSTRDEEPTDEASPPAIPATDDSPLFVFAPPCAADSELALADNVAVPAAAPPTWQFDWSAAGWLPLLGCAGSLRTTPPPAPPPRA
jgi:hypothetical protein